MKILKGHIREILLFTGLLAGLGAQAQVRAKEYNAGALPSNSIVYALPETKVYALVSIEQIEEKPGEFWQYAHRYLGVKSVIKETKSSFRIKSVEIGTYGVPSDSLRYSVEFRRNSSATNLTLTNNDILLAVNVPGTKPEQLPAEENKEISSRDRFTRLTSMPAAYIQATTVGKKAEIAAEEIYRLRESRTAIISGESDQPFPDGDAMKIAIQGLDDNERSLTERFIGTKETISFSKLVLGLDPADEGRHVAFRFSEEMGLLPADDLRGEPIYLVIKITDKAQELDERAQKKKERHLRDGLIYTVPGEVKAELMDHNGNTLTSRTLPVAQLGTQEALEPELFTNNKILTSVTFHQSNGGIKEVTSSNK